MYFYEDGELRISSSSGAVKVDELVAKGSIRVETESGGITLIISVADGKAGFSGTFQIATGGHIRMEPEAEVAETEEEAADKEIFVNQKSDNLWEGSIGCHKDNDCNYRGELLITSSGEYHCHCWRIHRKRLNGQN